MAVVYTTATLVRKRIEDIDATLVDADIDQYIYEAESIIDCVMKTSFVTTFSATKHSILRSCASDIAAKSCVHFDPGAYPSLEAAEMVVNMLQDSIQLAFYILSDPRTVEYLKSL